MNYGEKLKDIRFDKNVTQQMIADLLNISRSTYKDYEIQIRVLPLKYLIIICNYFDISIDYLFNFTNITKYKNINNNIDNKVFKERFKDFRKKHKITQEQLAKFLNTSHSVISDYEQGKKIINTAFLFAICDKYKISADYLLGRIDYPKYYN